MARFLTNTCPGAGSWRRSRERAAAEKKDMQRHRPMRAKLQNLADIGAPRRSGNEIDRPRVQTALVPIGPELLISADNVIGIKQREMRLAQKVQRDRVFAARGEDKTPRLGDAEFG